MNIARTGLAFVLAAACCAVQAQAYKWVDKDGKTRYGDFPPAGVKATPMRGVDPAPAPSPSPSASATTEKGDAAKSAPKGPLTPAEQAQAFRERQAKAKEAAEKAEKERANEDARKRNCAAAQESLRTLESGRRISSTNAQGETVFLDEAQMRQRAAEARKMVAESCK